MLNNRGDRDYSKDAELLKNGDFHEYKGGRGEFLLIQSYDMFVSTLFEVPLLPLRQAYLAIRNTVESVCTPT